MTASQPTSCETTDAVEAPCFVWNGFSPGSWTG